MTMAEQDSGGLNAGQTKQYGSPLELMSGPPSLSSAGFIALPKMNFVSRAPARAAGARDHRRPAGNICGSIARAGGTGNVTDSRRAHSAAGTRLL